MLFYTLGFSLPLLGSLLYISSLRGRLIMRLGRFGVGRGYLNIIWYFCRIWAFLVKLPIYIFHL